MSAASAGAASSARAVKSASKSARSARSAKSAKAVKPWDFRSHEGVDRIAMAALRQMADGFCRLASSRLSGWARARVPLHLDSLEQTEWENFEALVSGAGALVTFSFGSGPALLYVPAGLSMALLDLHLAGTGAGPFPQRPLSDMERQLLSPLLEAIAHELASAASATLSQVEAGPISHLGGHVGMFLADRRTPCIALRVSPRLAHSPDGAAQFDICLPVDTLRPLFVHLPRGRPRAGEETSAMAERAAGRIPLTLSLRYPSVAVPLQVAEGLVPGQVLGLGHPIGEPLLLCVGDKVLFAAAPLQQGRRAACQIVADPNT